VTSRAGSSRVTIGDTSVVVREMFAHAQQTVTVVGYAVYQRDRGYLSIGTDGWRIVPIGCASVLNISTSGPRGHGRVRNPCLALRRAFKSKQWPSGARLQRLTTPRSSPTKFRFDLPLHANDIGRPPARFRFIRKLTAGWSAKNIEVGLRLD